MQVCSAAGIGSSSEAWLSISKFAICHEKLVLSLSGIYYCWNLQIGFIGRLDYQKGIDLIRSAMPELMEADVQFVSYSICSINTCCGKQLNPWRGDI